MKNKFPRETLLEHCKDIKDFLDTNYPQCVESVEIVGSLRRGLQECGDIDLIIVPKFEKETPLFGEPTLLPLTDSIEWDKYAEIVKNGTKYTQLAKLLGPYRLNIDIYVAVEPEKYGVLKVIRTGPESFNKKYCIPKHLGGKLPQGFVVDDGYLLNNGEVVPCHTELDYFKAIGVEYIKPKDRV